MITPSSAAVAACGLGADPEIEEPDRSIWLLVAKVRKMNCEIGAIVADVRVTPPGAADKPDAVMLIMEARNGFVVRASLPYSGKGTNLAYGERFVQPDPEPVITDLHRSSGLPSRREERLGIRVRLRALLLRGTE